MKFKIFHDKPNCIGCGACAAVAEEYWEMIGDKSHLRGSTETSEGKEELILEKDFEMNEEAAMVCPVEVITIKKIE